MEKRGSVGNRLPVSSRRFETAEQTLRSSMEELKGEAGRILEDVDALAERVEALQHLIGDLRVELDAGRAEVRNACDVVMDGRREICNTYDVVMDGRKEICNTYDIAARALPSRYANVEYLLFDSANPVPREERILLAGWYGAGNYGDEIMLRTLLDAIPESALSRVCVLLCDSFGYSVSDLPPQVHCIHNPKSTWELDGLADLFGCVVWGGGAHIDDRQFTDDPLNVNTGNLLIRLSEKVLARGGRVYCLGLSSNEKITSEDYALRLNSIIGKANGFYLRDSYSADAIRSVLEPTEAIGKCDDIAFAHQMFASSHIRDPAGPVGFIPICDERLREDNAAIVSNIVSTLNLAGSSHRLRLIPFYEAGCDHDRAYLESLVKEMQEADIEILPYPDFRTCSAIAECSLVVSERYHGALIAGAFGIPTIALAWGSHPHYRNKMRYLMELLGLDGQLYSVSAFAQLSDGDVRNCLDNAKASYAARSACERSRKFLAGVCEGLV